MTDTQIAKDRIAFLRGLRAVRQFRPDPIPQEVVDDILEVARWSGSAGNRQP
jgi:nitroreductase